MRQRLWLCLFLLPAVFSTLYAQQKETIPPDRAMLFEGKPSEDINIADYCGYPTPERVLQWREQLGLTHEQISKTEEIQRNLGVSATVKGTEILEAEEELCKQLRNGIAHERQLRMLVETVAKKRAEYRYLFLQSYVRVKKLLNQQQLERYKELNERERN